MHLPTDSRGLAAISAPSGVGEWRGRRDLNPSATGEESALSASEAQSSDGTRAEVTACLGVLLGQTGAEGDALRALVAGWNDLAPDVRTRILGVAGLRDQSSPLD